MKDWQCLILRSLHRSSLFLNTGHKTVQVSSISVTIDHSVNSAAMINVLVRKGKQNVLMFVTHFNLCFCNNPMWTLLLRQRNILFSSWSNCILWCIPKLQTHICKRTQSHPFTSYHLVSFVDGTSLTCAEYSELKVLLWILTCITSFSCFVTAEHLPYNNQICHLQIPFGSFPQRTETACLLLIFLPDASYTALSSHMEGLLPTPSFQNPSNSQVCRRGMPFTLSSTLNHS